MSELFLLYMCPDNGLTAKSAIKPHEVLNLRKKFHTVATLKNSKTLSWSSIKMAFQNCRQISGIVKRPKALGDIRGISYIYPLFWKFGLIEVPEETAKKMSGECDTEAEL